MYCWTTMPKTRVRFSFLIFSTVKSCLLDPTLSGPKPLFPFLIVYDQNTWSFFFIAFFIALSLDEWHCSRWWKKRQNLEWIHWNIKYIKLIAWNIRYEEKNILQSLYKYALPWYPGPHRFIPIMMKNLKLFSPFSFIQHNSPFYAQKLHVQIFKMCVYICMCMCVCVRALEGWSQGQWGQDRQPQMKDNLWRSLLQGGEALVEHAHSDSLSFYI